MGWKSNHNDEALPFHSKPKYLGVTLDRSLTYRRHLLSLQKKLTSGAPLLRRLVDLGWGVGVTTLRTATSALVHSTAEHCALLSGAAVLKPASLTLPLTTPCKLWLDATSYTSGQPSNPRRHPTCWASLQRSHTVSSTPCHGAWTSAPLSASNGNAQPLKSKHPCVLAA